MAKKEAKEKSTSDQKVDNCIEFKPDAWNEKEISWKGKFFVKEKVPTFFGKMMSHEKILEKTNQKIEAAKAKSKVPFVLLDKGSMFSSNMYIEVAKPVQGLNDVKLTANFLSKVFEGKSKSINIWIKDMEKFVKTKGKTTKKNYFFIPYTKKCAKKFGKNYTVILAEI
jgi:hypothetical protein